MRCYIPAQLCLIKKNRKMKITITGSLGHISKPLTQILVQQGHTVTVISSNPERKKDIEALGAIAAIGSVEDVDFLTSAFTDADVVYCMIPPNHYYDPNLDLTAYVLQTANNYKQAIIHSGVKRVIHLSSIGTHLDQGTGLILTHRDAENILKEIPGISITHMRPTSFHYNLFSFIPVIKNTGVIASNYGADDMVIWVAPADIAEAVANEIVTPSQGRKIRYVASDELTCNEVAAILGAAIGKPDLKWEVISNEQMQAGMEAAGLNPKIAAGLVEMQSCIHSGIFFEDYYLNRPRLGKVKMTDFAKDFAIAYNQNK
jgi:uncharacterized protein YbjT (DUF2867 family)